MKQIRVKNTTVLLDGRTFMKIRVKYDVLFHEMYFTSLPSNLRDLSYVCNQIIKYHYKELIIMNQETPDE